ncbi:MAG: M14 family zinc carboxypeptidase [Kiritimatiellia bacterium]
MNPADDLQTLFGDLSPWREAPAFWPAHPRQGIPFLKSLKEAVVRSIGRSAGGLDILAVEYGTKDPLDTGTDNLQSALAAGLEKPDPTAIFPESFYGSARRTRPVLVLQGAIHGDEITGTAASLNLCHIIETGNDLRGRPWPDLRDMARAVRLCIVPWLNIDGAARSPVAHHSNMPASLSASLVGGVKNDGTVLRYPAFKNNFPIPPADMAFMGTYFNDAGVNLQYDFCLPRRQPETTAWMDYYLGERPDGVVIWHCNAGSLIGPPGFYLPPGHQIEEARIGGAVHARLLREGYDHPIAGRMSWASLPGMGKPFIEQSTAVYHACGALPVMCELPTGGNGCDASCDDLLTIGLLTIEEILRYAHNEGLRPYEYWKKVRGAARRTTP